MLTILFGAGAEQCFGLSGGCEFAQSVLGIGKDMLNEAVDTYYSKKIKTIDNEWYPAFRKNIWTVDILLDASLKKKNLDGIYDLKKDYELYIKKEKENLSEDQILSIIHDYPSYMGILDEHFHTLIQPKILGPHKFWRVVTAYARAYVFLIGQMLSHDKRSQENYYQILSNYDFTCEIMTDFAKSKSREESYYSVLKQYTGVKIATTNYTPLIGDISEIDPESIAYLHGKIGWFESPEELCVYDADIDSLDDKIVFPYIFLQSGIKPIVDIKGLNEYRKFLNFLDESDCIIIVGFRLNYDDDHINSILRSAILEGKKLIYFVYEDSIQSDVDVLKKLRLKDNNRQLLEIIHIRKDDCCTKFAEILNRYATAK